MKDFFTEMNPAVRGFLIIGVIVVAIATLNPVAITFGLIWTIARILFVFAIGFLVYRWWRDNRSEIELWSTRSRRVFYAAAALILVELAIAAVPFLIVLASISLLAWLLGIAICGYAMWRVWQDEHTYG
jgi:peptidoglycan/LPS O-acetylase OafA/YrhL